MSTVKSYSVGDGDMFYINHGSDSFTIIDCCFDQTDNSILNEVSTLSSKKGIHRFISTHPDDDHIQGVELLDKKIGLVNFYCVQNATKKDEKTESFKNYRELRDSDKAFYIFAGCT